MSTTPTIAPDAVAVRSPEVSDGVRLWEIARDTDVLDLNSSYAYVLWCEDYADTTVVATIDNHVVGFVTGYQRPQSPDTVMVWQVAVDDSFRGLGIARTMLQGLMDKAEARGLTTMTTTISPDNEASQALFASFAESRDMTITRRDLFAPNDFPDAHQPEDLYTIAPRS
ncbi:diaminobutyrate acetyltransferase [Williamsia sterculiae]|uniref:L-2,4-diaminobutyric acid acetyltransferase n=2 Tax=Williamsia sterculiae TaxID=1344003 RepID=A0A1N7GJ84_9NOCA|nr:diaminobutyrate acetyltransferase [Williamsia sterculiae]